MDESPEPSRQRAEFIALEMVLGVKHRLGPVQKGLQGMTFVELGALLDDREIEQPGEFVGLAEVVLQADRQPAFVRQISQHAVEAQLIGGRQRKTGVLRVIIQPIRFDAVESLVPTQVQPGRHQRSQRVQPANVQPTLIGPTRHRSAH